jgi:WD40 repeat protein
VAYSPDGKILATAGSSGPTIGPFRVVGTIKFWDPAKGKMLRESKQYRGVLRGLAFAPDGKVVAAGGMIASVQQGQLHSQGTLSLWDAATAELIAEKETPVGIASGVAYSDDGRLLAAEGSLGVSVWDAKLAGPPRGLPAQLRVGATLAFRPGGHVLASLEGPVIRLRDLESVAPPTTLRGHMATVSGIAFVDGGKRLIASDVAGTIRAWDVDADPQQADALALPGPMALAWRLAFSPDGTRLAVSSGEVSGTGVRVWDVDSRRLLNEYPGFGPRMVALAFAPDGRRLAAGGGFMRRKVEVRIHDLSDRGGTLTPTGLKEVVTALAYSPDGHRLAVATEGFRTPPILLVWDAATGKVEATLTAGSQLVAGLAFIDATTLVAADQEGIVLVLDVASGRVIRRFEAGAQVRALALGPGRKLVALARVEAPVAVFDLASGREAIRLREASSQSIAVAFHPDGRRLATGGEDKVVRIWDLLTGEETLALTGHSGPVTDLAFRPDGRMLASAAGQPMGTNEVFLWDATPLPDEERLRPRVQALYAETRLKDDVRDRFRRDPTLTARQRAAVGRLIDDVEEDPLVLNRLAWDVVRKPGADPDAYRLALRRIEVASRLAPDRPDLINTLGVAHYRAGNYAEAVRVLERSDTLARKKSPKGKPEDVAFLAMAHFRLGHRDEARRYLDRYRTSFAHPPSTAPNVQLQDALLRETEELIGAGGTPKK